MADQPADAIQGEVEEVFALERTLEQLEAELSQNEQFRNFLTKQKEAKDQIANTWKHIETAMIENNVKSIKGEWGSITIAERIGFDVDEDQLPAKFFKKVVDIKRIGDTFKLEGKPIKGAEVKYTKYLNKRIK